MNIAREILDKIESAPLTVAYFGLRVEDGRTFEIGEHLPNSRRYERDVLTGDDLDGISTVGVPKPTLSDVEDALRELGNYYGQTIVLVGGRYRSDGEDDAESVLRQAVALGVWERPNEGAGAHALYR